jgi:hypothetical protein
MRDIYLPWPRTEAELPVLRQVAREVIPGLRGEGPPSSASPAAARRRALVDLDADAVGRAYAGVREGLPRQMLDYLIDHPDERLDGAALMQRLGLARHDEVARTLAAIAADLARAGIAPPWNEAQAGYLLPAREAALLARARS